MTYEGVAAVRPAAPLVVVHDGEVMRVLEHRERHSAQLAWGYAGSGPADLALSILWDHLGEEPTVECYQRFKLGVLAALPLERWTIDRDRIVMWLSEFAATGGTTTVALEQAAEAAEGDQ